MEAIKDTIESVIRALEQKKRSDGAGDFEKILKKLLTKKENAHIKFNYFKGGIVHVNVDSSAWLYQVSLRKEELLEVLRKNFAGVKEIHFKLGVIK